MAKRRTTPKKTAAARKKRGRRKNPAKLVIRNASPPPKRRRKNAAKKKAAPKRKRCAPFSAMSVLFPKGKTRRNPITPEELDELAKRDKEFGKALRRHRRFHGTDPDSFELVELPGVKPDFKYGMVLGDTVAHEYNPHKTSGRRGIPFRHNFQKGKQVTLTDPAGRGVYVAKRQGSRLRVTDRGIID